MTGSFSDEALEQFAQLAAQTQAADFSEGDTYDFTRCVRPDGSFYGTRGQCKKGSQTGAKEAPVAAKPKRQRANSAELKATWGKVQKAVKAAKSELIRVNAETKGDKSPQAQGRRRAAGEALDRAERAALKMQDRFFAASKRESRAAMTPEQRKLEREANKLTKGG